MLKCKKSSRCIKLCLVLVSVLVLYTCLTGKPSDVAKSVTTQPMNWREQEVSLDEGHLDNASGLLLVDGNGGDITEKMHCLNQYIIYHTEIHRESRTIPVTDKVKVTSANGNHVGFFKMMSEARNILTLLLPWQLGGIEVSNYSYRCAIKVENGRGKIKWQYKKCKFEETSEKDILKSLPISRFYRCVYNRAMFNATLPEDPIWRNPDTNGRMCLQDLKSMNNTTKLWPEFFKYHSTSDSYYDQPFDYVYRSLHKSPGDKANGLKAQFSVSCLHCSHFPSAVTFIHLVYGNVRVSPHGYVENGHLKILPIGCQFGSNKGFNNDYPSKQPLFVITQTKTHNYYHQIVEMSLKMVIYAEFLKARPDVVIHAPSNKSTVWNMMNLLGLKNKIHVGHWAGSLAILPMGHGCHDVPLPAIQFANNYFQKHIPALVNNTKPLLIYIHRNHNRGITNRVETLTLLKEYLTNFRNIMDLYIFNDTALPSFADTIQIFKRAKFVIAPHGAGLSNFMFSGPKTFVIEIMCPAPYGRPAFRNMAYKLGMRYIAMLSTHAETDMGYRCAKGLGINIQELKASLDVIFPIIKEEM